MTMTLTSFQRQDEKLMCEKLPAVLNREGRENKHSRRQGESHQPWTGDKREQDQ